MDINKLLEGIDCTCNRAHSCEIKSVFIDRNAIDNLKEICGEYNTVLVVADENTFAAAGERTVDALREKSIKKVIFSGASILVPNEDAVSKVSDALENVDIIVGVGSGVIQDLCKYVSFQSKIPYLVVATAPSMDGYASNGAAMIMEGMKVTYPAGLPIAIVADTDVLKNAPIEMIKAGYGDIIGKFSALNDWKLSHCITGEYFCQYIYDITEEQVKRTLDLADGILKRNEESIQTLMEALVIIGIMMSFAGSSRPASGSEHHLSHFFEITGIINNTDYFPHGIDVAYSTVITAEIREKILNNTFPTKNYHPEQSKLNQRLSAIYKSVADGCIKLQEKVGNYTTNRTEIYLKKEDEIRKILSEMPSAQSIKEMLSLVQLDMDKFYAHYGEETIEEAVLYAKDLKDRYSVLWVNYSFFGDNKIF